MRAKTFIAGHRGLVGSAFHRLLANDPTRQIITRPRAELDLTDHAAAQRFFQTERPDEVLLAAARVGGIQANSDYPVDFLLDNVRIATNILDAAHRHGVKKLLFLGSSCIYPRLAPQPMREDYLLDGKLEPTNEPYAIAKIAGIKLAQAYRRQYGSNFIAVMPTNLYGPCDNFALATSHVLPALIRRFHDAKISGQPTVTLWGTGIARREFLHVDDCAEACLLLMERWDSPDIVNIGSGEDLTIRELAEVIRRIVGFQGEIAWDQSKPDGAPRKLLDVSRLRTLGWQPRISLEAGVRQTYDWFLANRATWRRM
ncbi:MAG: GDP-L-fucose synthase [Planctomycetes bacterium]|jgi:GDP-L-fucose synthase|nr:GDP-L-fucose synthase [Planctomycetota bacterium]